MEKDNIIQGANALLKGLLAGLKTEYFVSPRISLNLGVQVSRFFGSLAYQYNYGGDYFSEDAAILETSGWVPGITPYGDDLDISYTALSVLLGVSGSF